MSTAPAHLHGQSGVKLQSLGPLLQTIGITYTASVQLTTVEGQ